MRYSVAVKDSFEIITAFFRHWVAYWEAYFEAPCTLLTYGGEFINLCFSKMVGNLNIGVQNTAAQNL